MKKNIVLWMSMLALLTLAAGVCSCSSDDEDDETADAEIIKCATVLQRCSNR